MAGDGQKFSGPSRGNSASRGESRFVANTAALAASMAATTVVTLVQVKLLAAYLLPADFGLFAALRGFSLLVALLAANGFPQLLVRFLPYHESKRQLSRVIALSGVCLLAPLFLLTVFVFVIEANRSYFFEFAQRGVDPPTGLLLWFYITTLGVTLKLVLYGGFNGIRRLPAQMTLELTSLVVQVVWIYVWRDRLTLEGLFMILGITSVGTCVVGLPWYFGRLAADVSPGRQAKGGGTGDEHVDYRGYWLGALGLSLVAVAFTDVDRYVLSGVLAFEAIALFHIGSRILKLVNRFLAVPVLAFQPEVTRLDAEGRIDSIENSTKVFFKFSTTVAVFATFSILVFAPELIRVISNEQYDRAVPLLRILALSIPLGAMTAPLTSVMKALDEIRRAFYCDLAWAVTYLALLIVMGGAFGLVGVGYAQVCASLLQLALAIVLSRLDIGFRFSTVVFGKTALCGTLAFAPLIVSNAFLGLSLPALAVKASLLVIALILYRSMARFFSVFSDGERRTLVELLEKRGMGPVVKRIV
jgi:O-antigen/teichoic acid export membrane protein